MINYGNNGTVRGVKMIAFRTVMNVNIQIILLPMWAVKPVY